MAIQVITAEDLKKFKEEILTEIRSMIQRHSDGGCKKWLKSNEVRKLLKISPGTLQALRVKGTLKYSKVGGIIYYDREHVEKLLRSS
jgi:hypothetical protein